MMLLLPQARPDAPVAMESSLGLIVAHSAGGADACRRSPESQIVSVGVHFDGNRENRCTRCRAQWGVRTFRCRFPRMIVCLFGRNEGNTRRHQASGMPRHTRYLCTSRLELQFALTACCAGVNHCNIARLRGAQGGPRRHAAEASMCVLQCLKRMDALRHPRSVSPCSRAGLCASCLGPGEALALPCPCPMRGIGHRPEDVSQASSPIPRPLACSMAPHGRHR